MLQRRYWIHSGQQQQRECYHTLSTAVEASKFIAIACIRNPQRLHRFCRHRAHTHSLSLFSSLSLLPCKPLLFLAVSGPRKLPTETPPGRIGTSKVLDRNSRGPIGTSINSGPQKRFIACVPPSLRFGTSKPFSLALTIILHPYTQAYSMCLLFIYCINIIITHVYIQIGFFFLKM